MSLRYAYNTNGLSGHRLLDALDLLADHGYAGVALTLDHAHLDPYNADFPAQATRLRAELDTRGLGCVIETGARFLLDPRHKHEPTLVTADADGRARRVEFLRRCAQAAEILGAEALSFWAGVSRSGAEDSLVWSWLVDGVGQVVADARARGVVPALEPEPGMVVEHLGDYHRLRQEAGLADLRLALDTGHCVVAGDWTPQQAVLESAGELATVTVEDMPTGRHEHLVPGEGGGDVDLAAVLAAIAGIGWERLVCIELSRDSHRADALVPRVIDVLRGLE